MDAFSLRNITLTTAVITALVIVAPSTVLANSAKIISAGPNHSTIVKEDGSLWLWGIGLSHETPTQYIVDHDWQATANSTDKTLAIHSNGTLWIIDKQQLNSEESSRSQTAWLYQSHYLKQVGSDNTWQTIAAGDNHFLATKQDGSLWAWGLNDHGQLGSGSLFSRNSPTQIGNSKDWASVAAASHHSLALKSDGSLWAWGGNSAGQLGDGTTTNQTSPIKVGSDNDWQVIAAAGRYNLALKADNTLWAWGDNNFGQLGDGSKLAKTTPTQIGSDIDWQHISAGTSHVIALKTDSTLWSWGGNASGQLGNGTTTDHTFPTQVGSVNNWQTVSAANHLSLALRADGSVWQWGATTDSDYQLTPTLHQLYYLAQAIGPNHTLAIKDDGSLWAWGSNSNGQLGNDTTIDQPSPIQIGNQTDWHAISVGTYHSVAIKNDSSLWAWGDNNQYQLGNGTLIDAHRPTQIGSELDWYSIVATKNRTIALQSGGNVQAWGNGSGSTFSITESNLRWMRINTAGTLLSLGRNDEVLLTIEFDEPNSLLWTIYGAAGGNLIGGLEIDTFTLSANVNVVNLIDGGESDEDNLTVAGDGETSTLEGTVSSIELLISPGVGTLPICNTLYHPSDSHCYNHTDGSSLDLSSLNNFIIISEELESKEEDNESGGGSIGLISLLIMLIPLFYRRHTRLKRSLI